MNTNQLLENKLSNYNKSHSSFNYKNIAKSNKAIQVGGAMLAGLPLLMLPGEVHSQPMVTTLSAPGLCLPDPSAGPLSGRTLALDIDNGGVDDIRFNFYSVFGNGFFAGDPKPSDLLNISFSGASRSAAKLAYGATIASIPSVPNGGGLIASAYSGLFGGCYDFGNWSNDSSPGFLGFSFVSETSGLRHNGWVELSVIEDYCDSSSGLRKLTISRYAYEGTPNEPIYAGVGPAAPLTVPTLSEWGLITLALFLMTFGTVYIGRTQSMIAGSGSIRSIGSVLQKPPFVWSVLKKTLLATAGLAAIAGVLTYLVYGSIAAVDILGTAVAGPLLAYLMHLVIVFEKKRER